MTSTEHQAVKPFSLKDAPSLIEVALPVARLSAESYKERTAGSVQRLTGVGKWWGRKPLVLVRATILGCLLPATSNPNKDLEVFERLMGMDALGYFERRPRQIRSVEAFLKLSPAEQLRQASLAEAYGGPTDAASWTLINEHLGTRAGSLREVVEQLGVMRFGHLPKVGDAFCGGGSVPFEAARLGCDTYASDLNPVAGLLTWSNQALLCGTPADRTRIEAAQTQVYAKVGQQISDWGIEHDARGRRADAYLWCVEVQDPETGYRVPLAVTWVISQKDRVIAELVPDHAQRRYDIVVRTGATDAQMRAAKRGTVVDQYLTPPPTPENSKPHPTHMSRLRERSVLRPWESDDLVPRPDDFYQERLYCVRWCETSDVVTNSSIRTVSRRTYESVNDEDLEREQRALDLLRERLLDWQGAGFIPSQAIAPGMVNLSPNRTRGWTHWHQLFTPRQLLINGLFAEAIRRSEAPAELLGLIGKVTGNNAKLTNWNQTGSEPGTVFTGQSISPLYNYAVRGFTKLVNLDLPTDDLSSDTKAVNRSGALGELTLWSAGEADTGPHMPPVVTAAPFVVNLRDARAVDVERTLWITDPPYADAIRYEEISEFFLAWYQKQIPALFPDWYADSKRILAVKGKGQSFNTLMIDVYANLTRLMPDNGMQVVMFTHQDAAVWADLAMTMWAAGLKVTAAWTVATETTEGLKAETNSVQGTVIVVLRKRNNEVLLFLDELLPMMEDEVKRQLDSMRALEGAHFGDADLQLAAYAAALRVITGHDIDGIDPKRELLRDRRKGEKSRVQELIEQASQVAANHLIPRGVGRDLWRTLSAYERYYLKGLDVEASGEQREGVYAELARSFNVPRHTEMFGSKAVNSVRLSTPTELGLRQPFGLQDTLLRQVLTAVRLVAVKLEVKAGVTWLTSEVEGFQLHRTRVIALLHSLARMEQSSLPHWQTDGRAASLLAGTLEHHSA